MGFGAGAAVVAGGEAAEAEGAAVEAGAAAEVVVTAAAEAGGIPKVKPVAAVLAGVAPNLKPDDSAGCCTPKVKPEVVVVAGAPAGIPNENLGGDAGVGVASLSCASEPGFLAPQATHLSDAALLVIMQSEQSHEPSAFLNLSPHPEVVEAMLEVVVVDAVAEVAAAPGRFVVQA